MCVMAQKGKPVKLDFMAMSLVYSYCEDLMNGLRVVIREPSANHLLDLHKFHTSDSISQYIHRDLFSGQSTHYAI